ncbi:hypothetical protein CDAR_52221 [Caerostris darwini]|uniref:Uncharacterized protein n=1 Tax=Caerostris darwini TaxID=1538125 RepID=A0AAV4V2B9_9ARAC|nr:hypothetical protein CDAR_52221 [Caerostris darwini]
MGSVVPRFERREGDGVIKCISFSPFLHGVRCPRIRRLNQQEFNILPSPWKTASCALLMTRPPVHAHSDGQACACDAILINTRRKFGGKRRADRSPMEVDGRLLRGVPRTAGVEWRG